MFPALSNRTKSTSSHHHRHPNLNRKLSPRRSYYPNRYWKPLRCRRPATPRKISKRNRSRNRLPHCRMLSSRGSAAEGSAAGAGDLFGKGDVGVVAGSGVEGGGGGRGTSGLGRGAKGDGTGGGEALSGLARPLGGYQIKASLSRIGHAERACRASLSCESGCWRTAGSETCIVEQSAGFRDLDISADRRQLKNGSSNRREGAKMRWQFGSCCR